MIIKIAITGSTASGKSTATKILSDFLECENYSADKIVAELYENPDFCNKNLKSFENYIFNEKNLVDKSKLKDWIISDPENLNVISSIVWKEFKTRIFEIFENCKTKFLVFEIPLLFESKSETLFDIIINIEVDSKSQKERAKNFSKIDEEFLKIFIKNQVSNEFRKLNSNFTIKNFDNLITFKKDIENIAVEISNKTIL